MTNLEIKQFFYKELLSTYSKNEIQSIWNLCLEFILKMNKNIFITNPDTAVNERKFNKIKEIIIRLKMHEPIQYITGKSWFCDSIFEVNPSVLIPRPETEELVYKVIQSLSNYESNIMDIGSGSGCIAISIKKFKPNCNITAIDNSQASIKIAQKNAKQILSNHNIKFVHQDVLAIEFASHFKIKFDAIVSNPPYIPENEKKNIAPNVLNFEPHSALFCGTEPMLFYNAIAFHASHLLKPKGLLFFEIHENFGNKILNLLKLKNFENIKLIKDAQGKNRMIEATR